MAVATDFQCLRAELNCTMYELDAEGPADVAWVDMNEYESILIGVMRSVGTGALDEFRILANSASGGSRTDVEIKDLGATIEATVDAVGDYVWLEASAEEIGAAGADLRYVSASVGHATATDESVVTYIRKGKRAYKDQTANNIS